MKIVFAGQPYSGKTSVSEALQHRVNPSARLHFISEVATGILSKNPLAHQQKIAFQKRIFELQRAEEAKFNDSVIITDRGLLDALVYLTDDEVAESHILDSITMEQLYSNYDLVLFFEKNPERQRSTATTIRVEENDSEIEYLSRRTLEVWSKHSNVIYIPHFPTLEEKVNHVARVLNSFSDTDIFI